jgi:hypothetical protein
VRIPSKTIRGIFPRIPATSFARARPRKKVTAMAAAAVRMEMRIGEMSMLLVYRAVEKP